MSKQLFLVRHPAVAVAAGVCYGASDVALAEDPAESALRLRAHWPPGSRVISSPLSRCLQLARLLVDDSGQLSIDARLREIDFGDWELQRYEAIDRALIDAWATDPWGHVPPRGESADAMAARVLTLLAELQASDDRPIVIVSHAGPLRVLMGTLRTLPKSQWLQQDCAYASCVELRCPNQAGSRLPY